MGNAGGTVKSSRDLSKARLALRKVNWAWSLKAGEVARVIQPAIQVRAAHRIVHFAYSPPPVAGDADWPLDFARGPEPAVGIVRATYGSFAEHLLSASRGRTNLAKD